MANSAFAANVLTGGGTGALDDINHATIEDGDFAMVADHANELWYVYTYDSSCTDSESSPSIIIPDSNTSGTGAWKLIGRSIDTSVFMLNEYTSLSNAISTIGASEGELWIDQDDTMTGNVTVPSTLNLRFIKGNTIDPNGNTLTIYSPANVLASPGQKIFEEAVTFSKQGTIPIGWFGALEDGSTDDATAWGYAVSSAAEDGGAVITYNGRTVIGSEIEINKSNIQIVGPGRAGKDFVAGHGGSEIIIGANIAGAVFKFISAGGTYGSRGCGIRHASFDGDERGYTVTAAVHVYRSDQFRMHNVDFGEIAGRAIYTQRCVKSSFKSIDIYKCGDTSDPALDVNHIDASDFTQSSVFEDIKIEVSYNSQYLNISSNSVNNKFENIGFETNSATAATEQRYISCAGGQNQFNMIHMNRNSGTDSRILISGHRNVLTNIKSEGDHGGDVIEVTSNHNVITAVQATDNAVGASHRIVYINEGDVNVLTALHSNFLGGVEVSSGGLGNVINGLRHYSGGGNTLKLSGIENTATDINSDDFRGSDPIVDLIGNYNRLNGGTIIDCTSSQIGVDIDGGYCSVSSLLIKGLTHASAYAIVIDGNYNLVHGVQLVGNTNNIQDNGTGTVIQKNRGDEETITTDAQTLQHWGATKIDTTSGALSGTLGSGGYVGQIKTIIMETDGGDYTLSVTNHETSDPEVFTLDDVDDALILMWTGTEWITIKNSGCPTP